MAVESGASNGRRRRARTGSADDGPPVNGRRAHAANLGARAERDGPVKYDDLTEAERGRLALRQVQRKLSKNEASVRLVTLPGVQPISSMTRFIDGGRERFVELVQMAVLNNEPIACQWWEVYRELPSYPRSIVSFDDVCAASGVSPRDLLLCLVSTAMDFGQDVGNLVAAVMHPKIVSRLAESAERIDGPHAGIALKDRHAFLQARGVLPVAKSAIINVHASATAQAAAAASKEPSVPSFHDTIAATARTENPIHTEPLERPEPVTPPIPERPALPPPTANPIDAIISARREPEPVHVRRDDHGAEGQ